MGKPLILVTGATGNIGSEVTKQLLAADQPVRILVRDRSKAAQFSAAQVMVGDLSNPETLVEAFNGVDKAFVLSRMNVQHEVNAFEAAKRAGVAHVVKLSARGVDSYTKGTFIAEVHLETERRLRESGIPWTIIRPGFYASNFLTALRVLQLGEIRVPAGNGKDCPIDPRDVAAVAVKALTTSGHDGKIYEITGPDLLSYPEMAQIMAAVSGKELKYIDIPASTFREVRVAAGVPEPMIASNLHYFTAVKEGRLSTTSTFAELMGRKPRSLEEWFRACYAQSGDQS
jgi:uncharacterized protein YbjT (DUF2867 family)